MERITKTNDTVDCCDDDDEESGRMLTEDEYVKQLNERADIFVCEKDRKLKTIFPMAMILGMTLGAWFATAEILHIDPTFGIIIKRKVTLAEDIVIEEPKVETVTPQEVEKQRVDIRKTESPKNSRGIRGSSGDPTAVVTRKGVLAILSGAIKGTSVAHASEKALGGYTQGIDAVLRGTNGLTSGSDGGAGRAGVKKLGWGEGTGNGLGTGSGGVDDLISGLMGSGGTTMEITKRKQLSVDQPTGASSQDITGGRSRANIMRTVRQNLTSLQHSYTRRLTDIPGLSGRISVKWAIDEFGNVIFCSVESSTINDPKLEAEIIKKIKRWAFGRIHKPGDVTEVVYPFVFNEQ